MVEKVEKTHRKGTQEMGTGEQEMSGGSVMEIIQIPSCSI